MRQVLEVDLQFYAGDQRNKKPPVIAGGFLS